MSIAATPIDILRFLSWHGEDAVLVTLVAVHGSASRSVGTQMAVAADGTSFGSFSGGCIEAAVIAEALEVLTKGAGRTVRFGAGSPYIDVKLPCGGGIDLLFTPRPAQAVMQSALAALTARQPFAVALTPEGVSRADGTGFELVYHPKLRILVLGQGDDLRAFARLAHNYGAEVVAVVPAEQAAQLGPLPDIDVIAAPSRTALPELTTDHWTALVFLFHDRDWEEFLLPQALEREAFYYAAIGSPRTQVARREALRAAGVNESELARLRHSVGLIPSTRDPATLALSILAEIVADYQALIAR